MMKHRPLVGSSKSSILVVDNDAHIRRELVDILAHEGYHCIEARDGIEALERISSNQDRPDLFGCFHSPHERT